MTLRTVKPAQQPETAAGRLIRRLRQLAVDTHGEICMSRVIAAVDLAEEEMPAALAEARSAGAARAEAALREAAKRAFASARRRHMRLPESGADDIDAYIGDALNDVETTVLAALDAAPLAAREPGDGGLDVERLAMAMRQCGYWYWNDPVHDHAAKVAAAYDALAATPSRPAGGSAE